MKKKMALLAVGLFLTASPMLGCGGGGDSDSDICKDFCELAADCGFIPSSAVNQCASECKAECDDECIDEIKDVDRCSDF